MKRAALYSRRSVSGQKNPEGSAVVGESAAPSGLEFKASRMRQLYERLGWLALGALFSLSMLFVYDYFQPARTELTQEQIDAAVLHTLATKELPARAARAAALIAPSIVRIRGDILEAKGTQVGDDDFGVGTGVVIKDDGTILTNLHVVASAPRLVVTFADGLESPAVIVSAQRDKDLAVLKPLNIPDDLQPATLGSSQNLSPGDDVVAVGFPFGLGASVSAGVVSGLNRTFKPAEGPPLTGLIQFDAAANPGNSGGPLVNMAGEVLGIVTAILNPTSVRTFIGIGFAITIESAGTALGMPPF
ncbi:DegQ Trypsin-like serine proteases, typically periplasmic, contain C-terminal PDZ domain [Burkholderiaceae bacterium]|jgi:S1-C subfamily serine protease